MASRRSSSSKDSSKKQKVGNHVPAVLSPQSNLTSHSRSGMRSPTTTISTRGIESNNGSSVVSSDNHRAEELRSTPRHVWCDNHEVISGSKEEHTVTNVVSGAVFPKCKFVDTEQELNYSASKISICQYVIERCNLQADVNEAIWWRTANKYVVSTINRMRNDRNTAMKRAVLGKYSAVIECHDL